jgi:hypothetical protein
VNRWFDERTVLIGDAAHVFPPFGAQGIASGIRDAFALSWRISLMCDKTASAKTSDRHKGLLENWSIERRQGVDQASEMTMQNGNFLFIKSWLVAQVLSWTNASIQYSPWIRRQVLSRLLADREGYKRVKKGLFLSDSDGAGKLAQIWVQPRNGPPRRTDELFWREDTIFTLLVVGKPVDSEESSRIQEALRAANVPAHVLSREVVGISFDKDNRTSIPSSTASFAYPSVQYFACDQSDLENSGITPIAGYDPACYLERFQRQTRYALVRPDFIFFSQASTLQQLSSQLDRAKVMLAG